MARIELPTIETAHPEAASQLAEVLTKRGYVSDFHLALSLVPGALPAFETMSLTLRSTSLDDRLRELLILRVVVHLQSRYEWRRHSVSGRTAGLSDDQIMNVGDWRSSAAYDSQMRAVLAFADAHLEGADTDTELQALAEEFGAETAISICLLVGWYLFVNAVIQPLRLDETDDHKGSGLAMPRPAGESR